MSEKELPDAEDPAKEIVTDEMTAEEAASDPAAPKRRRLTQAEWAEAVSRYEVLGEDTNVICKAFGISPSAFSNHLARAAAKGILIKKGSKAHLVKAKVAEKIVEKAAEAAATAAVAEETFETKRKARIERTKETLYRQSEGIQILQQQLLKEIADSKGLIKPGDRMADFKALKIASATNREIMEARWRVLDIAGEINEAALPVLEIKDLSQAKIDEMQSKAAEEGEDEDEDDFPEITDEDEVA